MSIRRKWLWGLLAAVVFTGLLGRYLDRVPKRHYCDFRVYHHASVRMAAGEDIYVRDTMAVTPFKYSPFFAFCFIPLGLLPIKIAAGLFFALNFILTIVLFRLAADIAEVRAAAARAGALPLLYGLAVLFSARFIFLVWDSGQVNILMCVLVLAGLMLVSKGKDMPAGACLAAAILIKYVPAVF
ncbi:MAG: DUF2029 domain-containing protein, partial [Candidatus Omnitrophica bacterium]|nr:DUF2029 domain-containing protein [Candidatus Omnitrophota bacterium]